MKIAIVLPIKAAGSGGLVKHLIEVVSRWSNNEKVSSIDIYAPMAAIPWLSFLSSPRVKIFKIGLIDRLSRYATLARRIDAAVYDAVLCAVARHIPFINTPVVTIVQNVEPIQIPFYEMPIFWRLRLMALRFESLLAIRCSNRVIAISEHVRNCLLSVIPGLGRQITVVYHGFDLDSSDGEKPNIDFQGRFLFSAGSVVPYRGYEDIISALGILRRQGKSIPFLILAGETARFAASYQAKLLRLVNDSGVADRVIWAGGLSREEMSWCYRNAFAFVQASRAEACPNIVLEVMGHGCLSISCDNPPMPEIFGDAAVYYSTGNAEDLANKINFLFSMGEEYLEGLRKHALLTINDYSWDVTATKTLEALESVSAGVFVSN